MNADEPHNQKAQSGYWKYVPEIIVVLVTGAIIQGIMLWGNNRVLTRDVEELGRAVDALTAAIPAIAQQAHENSIHRTEHEKTAEREIRRIDENDKRGHENESRSRANAQAIQELRNNANARADPNTGTQGRERDRRLDLLERRLNSQK